MNKLISFYKSQKQKFWTHFLLPFTYILGTTIIFTYYIEDPFVFYATFAYLCVFPIIIYIAIVECLLKNKINNKFLLENKVYNIIWNIGNLLAFIFVLSMIYIIFNLP